MEANASVEVKSTTSIDQRPCDSSSPPPLKALPPRRLYPTASIGQLEGSWKCTAAVREACAAVEGVSLSF